MAESIPRMHVEEGVTTIHAALQEAGAVIVEDLLSAEVLARLNADLDPFVEQADPDRKLLNPGVEFFFGHNTRHVTAVAARSRTFAVDVMCNPLLLGLCDEILLPSCARYQLNLGHVLDRGPGVDPQLLHRDQLVWNDVPKPHPELQVATVIALVDFTEENGATRVIPGSHRWPADRVPREDETVAAEMKAGSGVIYLGSTIHGAGGNRSEHWRRGMHMSYVLGWLRTEENAYLAMPPDAVRDLPRPALELLGYAAHDALARGGGYLGAVDVRDPIDLLERGEL